MSRQRSDDDVLLFGGVKVNNTQFDLSDDSTRIASVRITNTIFIVLVVSVVGVRIFARAKYVHNIFMDDVLIIFAAAFTVALSLTSIAAADHGLGVHIWHIPRAVAIVTMKNFILMDRCRYGVFLYICQILYAFAIALTKFAIISSYLRFIQDRAFRITMYVTSFVIASLWITGVFVIIFQCSPISGAWDYTIQGECIDYINYLYVSSVLNAITDVILCIMPLPHFWRLNMPLKQRIILCVLLAAGASACVVGVVRISFLETLRVLDTTYQSVPCLILSVGECSLGIISVSIPVLRPLAQRMFPSSMRASHSVSSQQRTWHVRLGSIPRNRSGTRLESEDKNVSSTSNGA